MFSGWCVELIIRWLQSLPFRMSLIVLQSAAGAVWRTRQCLWGIAFGAKRSKPTRFL